MILFYKYIFLGHPVYHSYFANASKKHLRTRKTRKRTNDDGGGLKHSKGKVLEYHGLDFVEQLAFHLKSVLPFIFRFRRLPRGPIPSGGMCRSSEASHLSDRGGRWTSLDESFARCFAIF